MLLAFSAFGAVVCGCRQPAASPVTAPQVVGVSAAPAPAPAAALPAVNQAQHPAFDSTLAFAQLKKQCDFGPHPLGSSAHEKLRDYLIAEMKKYADKTILQDFKYKDLPVTNVVGVFYPEGASKASGTPVLLTAHWDTRPVADSRLSSEMRKLPPFRFRNGKWNRETPILGANDGASGVAVLLDLARMFKQKRPPVGVLIMLNDGEDYGDFSANNGKGDGVLLGAQYFADHYRETKEFGKPDFGILLDMVGGKNLYIPREEFSQRFAPGANEKVFAAASALGYRDVFDSANSQEIDDDHLPLNMAGIPTIDLIVPFGSDSPNSYKEWHTPEDTADKCSPRSLKIVGETVAEVVYGESPRP